MTWLLPPDSRAMTHDWNDPSPAVETVVDCTGAAATGAACAATAGAAACPPEEAEVLTVLGAGAGARVAGAPGTLAGLAGTASTCPTPITFAYVIWLWLAQKS